MHFNIIWVFAEKMGASLLSVVVFFIYAKLLAPEEFGVAVIILSVTQFLGILITTLFEDTMVQKHNPEEVDYDTIFWASAGMAVFSMIACAIGFYIWSAQHANPKIFHLGLFATIEILATNLNVTHVAKLRRAGNFKLLAIRVLVGKLSGSFLGLVCVLSHLGALSIIVQSVVGMCVQAVILYRANRHIPDLRFDFQYLKQSLSFGSLVALRRMSWDMLVRLTPVVAGAVGGTALAGLVGFAWRIVELIRSAIASALYSYLLPVLSRQQHDKAQMARSYVSISELIAYGVTPVFLGLFAIAPSMVTGIFDPKWNGTIVPIQFFCLAALFNTYRIVIPLCFTALKKPGQLLMVELVSTGITVLAMMQFGKYGAWVFGMLHVLRMSIILPFGNQLMHRILNLTPMEQWRPIFRCLLPGLVMFITLEIFEMLTFGRGTLMHMLIQIPLGAVVFALMSWFYFRADVRKWRHGLFAK